MSEIFKIVTFNIRCPQEVDGKNHWDNRKEIVDEYIENSDADIICLQEVRPSVKEHFINAHKGFQFYGDFRFVPQREYDETPLVGLKSGKFALLSYARRWLSPTPEVAESKYIEDNFWPRVYVELKLKRISDGKEFYLINTHFELDDYSVKMSYLQLINRVNELKKENVPVFITGDLNQKSDFFEKLNDGTFTDISSGPEYTFQGFGRLFEKIDYILTSERDLKYKVKTAKVIKDGIYISDHFPVECEIENF